MKIDAPLIKVKIVRTKKRHKRLNDRKGRYILIFEKSAIDLKMKSQDRKKRNFLVNFAENCAFLLGIVT